MHFWSMCWCVCFKGVMEGPFSLSPELWLISQYRGVWSLPRALNSKPAGVVAVRLGETAHTKAELTETHGHTCISLFLHTQTLRPNRPFQLPCCLCHFPWCTAGPVHTQCGEKERERQRALEVKCPLAMMWLLSYPIGFSKYLLLWQCKHTRTFSQAYLHMDRHVIFYWDFLNLKLDKS